MHERSDTLSSVRSLASIHSDSSLRRSSSDLHTPRSSAGRKMGGMHGLRASSKQKSGVDAIKDSDIETMFDQARKQFDIVVQQRMDSFDRLERDISEVGKDIVGCKTKTGQLSQKLEELDALIDTEQAKWRAVLNEGE